MTVICPLKEPLPLGRLTPFGRVGGVGITGGERYYWLVDDKTQAVSMVPWFDVEPAMDQPWFIADALDAGNLT